MDIRQVTETIAMIEEQNFDIRTITMGISLLDCIDPDINRAAEKIYNKVVSKASNLVKVGDEIVVKALGYDNRGRLNLSRKDALPKDESKKEKKSK